MEQKRTEPKDRLAKFRKMTNRQKQKYIQESFKRFQQAILDGTIQYNRFVK